LRPGGGQDLCSLAIGQFQPCTERVRPLAGSCLLGRHGSDSS
jgi:hypothetical protein